MNRDFILLNEIGVGCVSVRHSEIVKLETLVSCATRVYLSTGDNIIVEESQVYILRTIGCLSEELPEPEKVEVKPENKK
mgnify:CR=1 FL=1